MKRIVKYILLHLILGVFLCVSPESMGSEVRDFIDDGNKAYTARQYDSALVYYEEAWTLDSNSSLIHFNLGNTYYRLGELAPAIWHYKVAKKLSPNDEDVKANLALVESQRTDEIEPVPQSIGNQIGQFIAGLFGYNTWLFICIGLSLLAAVSWGAFALGGNKSQKKAGFVAGIILTIVFLLSVLNFSRVHYNYYERDNAIVFDPTLNVVNEPSENASTLFVLHEGTEVSVKEERNNWLRIRILDGSEGWVLENAVKRY